ncbi:MAG: GerAB/ArcD/ProY family transporter [Clostridiaceae bacterium]
MNDTNNLITSKQLMSFIISAQIGFGVLSLPSDLAQFLGHDGWISLLMSGIIILLISSLLMVLLKRFKDKSIFKINKIAFGKILGSIFNIILIIHLIFLTTVGIRSFSEILSVVILKSTPQIATVISILIPTMYMTSKGLKVICRYTSSLYISYIALILLLLLSKNKFIYTFLLPVNEIGFPTLIKFYYVPFFSFIGYNLAAIIHNNVRDKENSTKYMIFAQIFVVIFFLVITILITLVFGENKLKIMILPVFTAIQALHMPVIEHLDTIFILFWFPTMASSFNCFYFCSYYSLMKAFNLRNKNLVLCLLSVIILFISRIPKNYFHLMFYIRLTWKFDLIITGIILISLILSTFKKKDVTLR